MMMLSWSRTTISPSSSSQALVLVAAVLSYLVSYSGHVAAAAVAGHPDYADALAKSILFFQGQRSGRLPPDQAVAWRSNSGLSDGSAANVDLTGGYYDGGDNVKFGFPMAFTATMLSWGIVEYGGRMQGRVRDARAATAAALAAASLAFKAADPAYSRRLVAAAKDTMAFAVRYQGKYSDHVGGDVGAYYASYSGYQDELLWGSAWLLWATKDASYLDYLTSLGDNDGVDMFSWDNKLAGARVLLSRRALVSGDRRLDSFRRQAEDFLCRILPGSPSSTTQYTPGGLMYKSGHANLQYVTSASFLLATFAKYMAVSNHTFSCLSLPVTAKTLRALAKKQVDYILGANPQGMSYMVGYGARFPQRIHHRAASMPSVAAHPARIGCQEGFSSYFNAAGANPNVHTGAVIGGPDKNDAFPDERGDYDRSEPTTYTNAALVGCLAYFAESYKS
uniref:Endoglucanase n=1 Tax=Oryza brachyantha TaxID=4533 RepID=J3LY73_ORYBR